MLINSLRHLANRKDHLKMIDHEFL